MFHSSNHSLIFVLSAIGALCACSQPDQVPASSAAAPVSPPKASPGPTPESTPFTTPSETPRLTPEATPMAEVEELKSVTARGTDIWQAINASSGGAPVLTITGMVLTRNPGVELSLEPAGASADPATLALRLKMAQREGFWAQVMKSRPVTHTCDDCAAVQTVTVVYPEGEVVSIPVNRR